MSGSDAGEGSEDGEGSEEGSEEYGAGSGTEDTDVKYAEEMES
jgi:hypothetical protein